jgi:hypothetical protein
MSKVLQGSFPSSPFTGLTTASTSYFFKMGMGSCNSTITTEAQQQTIERFGGTYSRMGIHITANSRLTAGTLRSRKNNANGNQSASIVASTTGRFEDASNTDTVAAADTFGAAMTNGTGSAALSVNHVYCAYSATGAHRSHINVEGTSTFPAAASASTLYRTQPMGAMSAAMATSDTNIWVPNRAGGSLTNFSVFASANTATTDSTAGVRLNATTAGNNVVTIPLGTTGEFEDTTHSDAITNSTNYAFYVLRSTGTGSITIRRMSCVFTGTGNYSDVGSALCSSLARSLNGTNYSRILGHLTLDTTESNMQVRMPFDGRASNLRVHSSTVNSITTIKLRKNGVDGNQAVSSPSSGSGVYEDTTSHDDFVDTDLLSLSWTSASASSSNFGDAQLYLTPPPVIGGGGQQGLLQIIC